VGQTHDKKLGRKLKRTREKANDAAYRAAQSELLLADEPGFLEAEGPMERTYKVTQADIAANVDLETSNKIFTLQLDHLGPYRLDYTRNGRWMLIGGRKGHVGTFDWRTGTLGTELHLNETVRDVKWLHNETMFAVAQKKYTYIYDSTGLELHCLRKHIDVNRLEFLPYHFLLATVGNAGWLRYQDTSTGQFVAELRTRLGRCETMAQNPHNAIINLGHANGTVTMWSPNMSEPLVKMLCHRGPVHAIAVDNGGNYMATAGLDGQLKVWDVRTYKPVHEYFSPTPATALSISQRGLLAVSYGPHVAVWKDAFREKQKAPYMSHLEPGKQIVDIEFCPFEDVLALGHSGGISSVVVPGSGEPNYDSLEANPFQTKKQRREKEVKQLLDKIQPEMITLNPDFIGTVASSSTEAVKEIKEVEDEANGTPKSPELKFKKRGRSSAQRRYLRKQQNVVDAKREALKEKLEREKEQRKREREQQGEVPWSPLDRFKRPKA
ncbi:WD40-repeat-containing domain protein, partial [Hyaloraphidium curvatum]